MVITAVVVACHIAAPVATLLRTTTLSFLCLCVVSYWSTPSPILLLLKLAVTGVFILLALFLLRECDHDERQALLALLRRPAGPDGRNGELPRSLVTRVHDRTE